MTSCAIDGVILTLRVKHSLASDILPSRSSCLPFCRFACRRLLMKYTLNIINFYLNELTFSPVNILFLLAPGLLHFLFGWQVTSVKHQDWLNTKRKQHIQKLHTVWHIPDGHTLNVSMRNAHFNLENDAGNDWTAEILIGYCMQINETTHWSVGSPFASFSAHENAPLWSQQYVSTATVCPRYFFTLIGSEASLINCNRPWIPMLSVWKDRCLKMMV